MYQPGPFEHSEETFNKEEVWNKGSCVADYHSNVEIHVFRLKIYLHSIFLSFLIWGRVHKADVSVRSTYVRRKYVAEFESVCSTEACRKFSRKIASELTLVGVTLAYRIHFKLFR